jgi:hypothetical protein
LVLIEICILHRIINYIYTDRHHIMISFNVHHRRMLCWQIDVFPMNSILSCGNTKCIFTGTLRAKISNKVWRDWVVGRAFFN